MTAALHAKGLRFDLSYTALNLSIQPRSLAFVLGATGSGKSALLLTLAGVNRAQAGEININGLDPFSGSEKEWLRHRPKIGYVLPSRTLVSHLTILQNIMLPLTYHGFASPLEAADIARNMMSWLGISSDANELPAICDEAERRLITLARALVLKPEILFVDQAFAHLDAITRQHFIDMYRNFLNELGISLILASKDLLAVAGLADAVEAKQTFIFLANEEILYFDSWAAMESSTNTEITKYLDMHLPKQLLRSKG